jgi:hypothetical protein
MDSFDTYVLNDFYARISAEDGLSVIDFQAELVGLFERPRSECDLNDYRLSKRPWKKLADEITPISRFLRFRGVDSGRVRFPLDNHPPDGWLWQDEGNDRVGIEVTIAQARERLHLAKELVGKGLGRGFIGLPDDAPQTVFDQAMSKKRAMYSPDQALSATKRGIRRCLKRKDKPKFAGFILVIQAHLLSLPREYWETIKDDLYEAAAALPFAAVHVIGDANERLWGLQIK